jgi:hypothetical protein
MFCLQTTLGLQPNSFANNPATGTPVFGEFPEIAYKSHHFPSGLIYLKHGKHFAANRGYGISHIWAEHWPSVFDPKEALSKIVEQVSLIIQPGAAIHCEFAQMRGAHRTTIWKSSNGLAVLEMKKDGLGREYYSVVTAYKGQKANGPKIGAVA